MKNKTVRKLLTEDEVEVAQILLDLPKLFKREELINRYSFTWGRTKKRSVPPENTTAATAAEAGKSPSTPLCFDGGDRRKPPLVKAFKRKARDDLMEMCNRMCQQRDDLMKKVKAMRTLHQELSYENMELKATRQKLNYPRSMEEDLHIWNSPMKTSQQHCHEQITMFTPQTPQQQHCVQQLVVDPNNSKLVGVAKSNSNGGGRFGLLNQIDPRGNIHLETYKPLDQSNWLVMDNVLRVRNAAAAARKRRMLRRKENKSSLLALKLSRNCKR
ncbi:uncharacterized protein LOC143572113 [Bidens hawaiensis]|uniref:uncharacterized protein LOC143572113 n=1 Tax=Bidens hawaiensis TaxID=980011 RepID=UPI00404A1C45